MDNTNILKEKESLSKEEREKIFNQYKDLAYSISNNYGYNIGESKKDLEQIALMELWECTDRYDKEKGAFTTYATSCITAKVKQGLIEINGGTRRTTSMAFYTMMYIMQNRDKDSEQLILELEKFEWYKLDRQSFFAIYNNCINAPKSLEGMISEEEGGIGFDIEDKSKDTERDIGDKIYVLQCLNNIDMSLKEVSSNRNRELYMKWLNGMVYDEKVTLEELGEFYGITRERVRQIIESMNSKTRKILEKFHIFDR